MRLAFLSLAALAIGGLASCGLLSAVRTKVGRIGAVPATREGPKKAPSDERMAVGEVSFVSNRKPFVLVRVSQSLELPEKALLESRDQDGQIAHLRMSGEKRKDHFVADVVDGRPKLGDAVSLPFPKSPPANLLSVATPAPAPEEPTLAEPASSQDLPLVDTFDPSFALDPSAVAAPIEPSMAEEPAQPAEPPVPQAPETLPGQADDSFIKRVR